jgi:hypothetical protein
VVQSQSVVIENVPLTEDEESRLARCENTIKQGLQTFYEVGNALAEIRDERLYRKTHNAFDDYCQARWGMSKTHANRLIASANTVDRLAPMGVIPESERQTRPITRLEPEDQPIVWQRAVETAPNGKVTAAHVEQTVREWKSDDQNVFTDPEAEQYQELIEERAAQPSRVNAGLFTSATPEWYTPEKVIKLVIEVFGQIDLDPCSNSDDPLAANVPARSYYTATTNGLAQRWFRNVYMNPPYGDEIAPWVDRIVRAWKEGEIDQGIALVPGRVDTAWFQPLWDYPLCFVRGRLRFSGADNSAPFPSVLAYFGPDNDLFMDTFEEIGRCGVLK